MIEGFLTGLKFRFRDFWGGRKIWQVSLFWWLDLSRVFFGVFKTMSRFVVVPAYDIFIWYHIETVSIQFLEIFKARKFGMGFFGVLLETLGIFWGFDFCRSAIPPPPRSSPSLVPLMGTMYILFVYGVSDCIRLKLEFSRDTDYVSFGLHDNNTKPNCAVWKRCSSKVNIGHNRVSNTWHYCFDTVNIKFGHSEI